MRQIDPVVPRKLHEYCRKDILFVSGLSFVLLTCKREILAGMVMRVIPGHLIFIIAMCFVLGTLKKTRLRYSVPISGV